MKQNEHGIFPLLSFLLGCAAVASTLAYVAYRCYTDRAYKEKWKDYNDCGLA